MGKRIKPHRKRYPYMHPSSEGGCAVVVLMAMALPVIGGMVYALT